MPPKKRNRDDEPSTASVNNEKIKKEDISDVNDAAQLKEMLKNALVREERLKQEKEEALKEKDELQKSTQILNICSVIRSYVESEFLEKDKWKSLGHTFVWNFPCFIGFVAQHLDKFLAQGDDELQSSSCYLQGPAADSLWRMYQEFHGMAPAPQGLESYDCLLDHNECLYFRLDEETNPFPIGIVTSKNCYFERAITHIQDESDKTKWSLNPLWEQYKDIFQWMGLVPPQYEPVLRPTFEILGFSTKTDDATFGSATGILRLVLDRYWTDGPTSLKEYLERNKVTNACEFAFCLNIEGELRNFDMDTESFTVYDLKRETSVAFTASIDP